MWRNFCSSVGIQSTSAVPPTVRQKNNTHINNKSTISSGSSRTSKSPRRGRVTDAIATLYPINVPVPSRLGPNTLSKFYDENKRQLFANDKSFAIARERVEKEDARMRMLRLRSEMRNPPLDVQGNILPPASYKKYPSIATGISHPTSSSGAPSDISIPFLLSAKTGGGGGVVGGVGGRDTTAVFDLNNDLNNNSTRTTKRQPALKKLVYRQNHPDFNRVIQEQQLKDAFKISAHLI